MAEVIEAERPAQRTRRWWRSSSVLAVPLAAAVGLALLVGVAFGYGQPSADVMIDSAARISADPLASAADGALAVGVWGTVAAPGAAAAPAAAVSASPAVPAASPQKLADAQQGATALAAAPVATKIVSRNEVLRLVRANFPKEQVGNAMAVAQCESGQQSIRGSVNPDGTTDWGIFQLNDGGTLQSAMASIGHPTKDTRSAQVAGLNAALNVKAAAGIYRDRGWAPWVCAYKQQIVASLYSNKPGPMAGHYSTVGVELPDVKPGSQLPTASNGKKPKKPNKKPTPPNATPTVVRPTTPAVEAGGTGGSSPSTTPSPTGGSDGSSASPGVTP